MKRTIALALGLVLALAAPAAAQTTAACDPFTPAEFRGDVPTPREVIGIDLGERDVTVAESDRYLRAVAITGRRVISGSLGASVQGRPLLYAVVGRPENLRTRRLAAIRAAAMRLMDPDTPAEKAASIARRHPAIL